MAWRKPLADRKKTGDSLPIHIRDCKVYQSIHKASRWSKLKGGTRSDCHTHFISDKLGKVSVPYISFTDVTDCLKL